MGRSACDITAPMTNPIGAHHGGQTTGTYSGQWGAFFPVDGEQIGRIQDCTDSRLTALETAQQNDPRKG